MLSIPWTDVDKYYKEIITYANGTCDAFCLTFCSGQRFGTKIDEDGNIKTIEKEIYTILRPYLIHQIPDVRQWLYQKEIGYGTVACIYRCCLETKKILCSVNKMSNWYAYTYDDEPKQEKPWCDMKMPEDLCFLRDNRVWLETIMHERMCDIYKETTEDTQFLSALGVRYFYGKNVAGYYVEYDKDKL